MMNNGELYDNEMRTRIWPMERRPPPFRWTEE